MEVDIHNGVRARGDQLQGRKRRLTQGRARGRGGDEISAAGDKQSRLIEAVDVHQGVRAPRQEIRRKIKDQQRETSRAGALTVWRWMSTMG